MEKHRDPRGPASPVTGTLPGDSYRALFEALPVPVVISHRSDGMFVYANPAYCRLIGAPGSDALTGTVAGGRVVDSEKERAARARKAVAAGRRPKGDPRYHIWDFAHEHVIDVDVYVLPTRFEGQPAMLTLLLDATPASHAQEELATSEQSYRTLIENAADGMIVHRDGTVLYANPAGVALYGGKRAEDVVGRPIWDFIAPGSRALSEDRVRAITSDVTTLPPARVDLVDLKGRPLVAEAWDVRIPYKGEPAVLTTIRDLTPALEAEEELRESEERYRSVVSSLHEGVILQAADGRILTFNQTAADVFGIGREDAVGQTSTSRDWGTIREDGSDLPGEEHPSMITLSTGSPCVDFLMGVRGPSGLRWIEVSTEPLVRSGETLPYAVVISFTDTTERRQTDTELGVYRAGLEHAVEERTRELTEANRALEEASRAKSAFMASMSHELRTPLNSIIGFSGIMQQGLAGPLSDEQQRQVEMINRSGRQLLSLVGDILDLEKIEGGRTEIRVDEFDVPHFVASIADTVRPMAVEKGLTVTVDVDRAPATIVSDQAKLEQVLLNLLSNAIKYTTAGSVGMCVEERPDGTVAFAVSDTGIGIAREDHERIFEEFRQLPLAGYAKSPGSGLGLAICRSLADMLGGTIGVQSVPGEGSTFTLLIPSE